MMNFKQREVLESIVAGLRKEFPEVRLVGVEEITPFEFWVTLTEPDDEDRQLAMEELQGEMGTDALLDYGVNFHFMPAVSEALSRGFVPRRCHIDPKPQKRRPKK